jgi:hypothetical protein
MQNLTVHGKTFQMPTDTLPEVSKSHRSPDLQVADAADAIRALEEEKRSLQGIVCFLLRKNEELRNRINS